MRRFLIKIFKIVLAISVALLLTFLILIHNFFKPKTDDEITELFSEANVTLQLDYSAYKNQQFRIIKTHKELDTTLPNLVFVHGSPGSAMDFKRYLLDKDLNEKANLIAFDRVGYNQLNLGEIQSISFESELLNSLTAELDDANTILIGYSYGGPIALASKKSYKKIILCAPAIYSKVEPMFWFLNFYKWKVTRWTMPAMLKAASKEKLQHQKYLKEFEANWGDNPSEIYAVHGDVDWIVPYENSELLQNQFPKEKFELITLEEASHDLIWSRFNEIKQVLIKAITE